MPERTSIIGLGLIGGSIGAGLRQTGHRVRGYDPAPGRSPCALTLGLIDEVGATVAETVSDADVVILATPIFAILDSLEGVDNHAPPHAVILDVGSVKLPVVNAMSQLKGAARALGGHPLAGDERSGPEAADANLMREKKFILCPSAVTSRATVERAETLCRSLEAIPLVVDPARHDLVIAYTSHMPQFVSTVLALCIEDEYIGLWGQGLRDMTRLASSDPAMWRDIAGSNRDNILTAIRSFREKLASIAEMVESGNLTGIEEAVRSGGVAATSIRREITS